MKKESNGISIEENLGLVRLCAGRFSGRGIDYDDLFQAGCLGLIKAAGNFDPERGFKFSTYAVPVILGEIKRLFREGGALRISRGVRELSLKAQRIMEELSEKNGEFPTVSEIAAALGETTEKTAMALQAAMAPLSISSGEDEMDIPVEPPEEKCTERLTLYKILGSLNDKDMRLIKCRYFEGKTQTETAAELGMTQVQVSRREKKLLLYMRNSFDG